MAGGKAQFGQVDGGVGQRGDDVGRLAQRGVQRPRDARVGVAQARIAGMLLLTLRGTPTMYYGDELGIGRIEIPPDRVQDPWEKNEPGLGFNRDPERTPMQWDGGPHGGFSTREPWLPLSDTFDRCNVETMSADSGSILTFYRKLIRLRSTIPALAVGHYEAVDTGGDVLAYRRVHGADTLAIILNLGREPESVDLGSAMEGGIILLSTLGSRDGEAVGPTLAVAGDEGLVVRCTPS